MVLPWRRKRSACPVSCNHNIDASKGIKITIPPHFQCPISLELMKDPVMISTGITYDRKNIEKLMNSSSSSSGNKTICSVTNSAPEDLNPVPNHAMRRMIQDWCVEREMEHVPTPGVPVTPRGVNSVFASIEEAARHVDHEKCLELTFKIKNWAKESVRSRKCLVDNGGAKVLARCFEEFAGVSGKKHAVLLQELLSLLTWMSTVRAEGQLSNLVSNSSFLWMVEFLRSGNLFVRQNAVFLLKEILISNQRSVRVFVEIEGAIEALVKLIGNPEKSQTTTKASLMGIYCIISSSTTTNDKMIILRFLEIGLVSLLVELIVDREKGIGEKALCVLDAVCKFKHGRDGARDNALIIPLLIKKILRVSDIATQFAISIIWKLAKDEEEEEDTKQRESSVLVEAFRFGAFQKMLVLLQVGCGEETKEMASELLKLMNTQRAKLEAKCVDTSMDFKYVKRPF